MNYISNEIRTTNNKFKTFTTKRLSHKKKMIMALGIIANVKSDVIANKL